MLHGAPAQGARLWRSMASDKPVAIVADEIYLEHRPGPAHPERPERLEAIYSALAQYDRRRHLINLSPRRATEEELALVHSPKHIELIKQTSGKVVRLDPDTSTSSRSYEVALYAVGALLSAIDALLSGQAQRCFAFIRPPGHHAEPSRAMGFCLFNNVAIAAAYALAKGIKRVLVVDFDLHHSNGTQAAFYHDPRVLYISTHQYPYYPGTGSFTEIGTGEGKGFTLNFPLPAGTGDHTCNRIYSDIVAPICEQYSPELVLVSAGFDPYFEDPLGGLKLTAEGFAGIARTIISIANRSAKGRALFALEGGYSLKGLSESSLLVLDELLELGERRFEWREEPLFRQLFESAGNYFSNYWKI